MRTNIDIDDKLMKQAMKATGAKTKKAAVEAALQLTVDLRGQAAIRKLRGKVVWRNHDDEWVATDEQIREKRMSEERAASSNRPGSREAA